MKDLGKILFFVVAVIFFISYVQDAGIGNLSSSGSSFSSRSSSRSSSSSYSRSYDTNNDGVVSPEEYKQGEITRIAEELTELERLVVEAREEQNRSPYYGKITLRRGNTRAEEPRDEYVIVESSRSNTGAIVVSGWKLESLVTGERVSIPKGVPLLEDSRPWFGEKDVFLLPGESAVINSGFAAGINTGFLQNMCTGYLETQYDFTPSLRRSCPALEDEPLVTQLFTPSAFDDVEDYDICLDAIERAPRCEKYFPDLPHDDDLDQCRDFIKDYTNYEGCVELHKTDEDFLDDEWRLFLGARNDIWRGEREAIALLDKSGLVVDVLEIK